MTPSPGAGADARHGDRCHTAAGSAETCADLGLPCGDWKAIRSATVLHPRSVIFSGGIPGSMRRILIKYIYGIGQLVARGRGQACNLFHLYLYARFAHLKKK